MGQEIIMGPRFFQTIMGQRFIEGTIPAVLKEIKRLNDNLELLNKTMEKTLSEPSYKEDKEDE
jgi:hypothetical protein